MSLFIGSAPRLAERHRLRCRLPSRHHAHDALLAPNSSPGVGRISLRASTLRDQYFARPVLCAPAPVSWRAPVRGGPRGVLALRVEAESASLALISRAR